jgi:hypothetical protein
VSRERFSEDNAREDASVGDLALLADRVAKRQTSSILSTRMPSGLTCCF